MPLALPPPDRAALLLDIDGTLLDLALTPDLVVVPPGLIDSLQRLRRHLDDALAVVTGRPVEQADALLAGVPYAAAGEHGGAIRRRPEAPIEHAALPDLPEEWMGRAAALVEAHPGSLLERKRHGFVLHYRLAPAAGPALQAGAIGLVGQNTAFQVLEASMAWEIRPRGVDKGVAVQQLCAQAPFAGRLPIFIGDDVTDEDGIRVAQAMGGTGLRVDRAFGGPADVRAWLARSADGFDAGDAAWASPSSSG